MMVGIPTHHPGSHGRCQPKLRCSIGVGFPDHWVVGKPEVIVEAPNNFFFAPEFHPAANFTFQFWEGKISMCSFTVLTKRTRVLDQSFKNICHTRRSFDLTYCEDKNFKNTILPQDIYKMRIGIAAHSHTFVVQK
jgi:hypothetical protein